MIQQKLPRTPKVTQNIFWSHVQLKLKTKNCVAPLLKNNNDKNSVKFDDTEKANILPRQFSSVFTWEPVGETPAFDKRMNTRIFNLHITVKMVRQEFLNINANKSCGPDEIHPRHLIELVGFISKPIALLLNKSMELGVIPRDWKRVPNI